MIDRIAKVLCADAGEIGNMPTTYHPTVDFVWQHYRVAARAVLEAMRDPTDAMVDAGDDQDGSGAEYSGYSTIPASAAAHYRAMIDAALQEKEAGE